jgi:hypothetical protein
MVVSAPAADSTAYNFKKLLHFVVDLRLPVGLE